MMDGVVHRTKSTSDSIFPTIGEYQERGNLSSSPSIKYMNASSEAESQVIVKRRDGNNTRQISSSG